MKNYNTDNLRPPFTPSEAREMGKKGASKSHESRRKKKQLRELLDAALDTVLRGKNGEPIPNPSTGKRMTLREAGMVKLAGKYANGDLKAIEQAARLLGEWEENLNLNADVNTTGEVVMGFDPKAAFRELMEKGGTDE